MAARTISRLFLRMLAGLVAFVLVAATVLLWWAGQTDSFLRWSLARAVAASHGSLHVGHVQGTLLGGFRLDSVRWSDGAHDVTIDDLRARLRADALLRGELHLSQIAAADVRVVLHPTEEASEVQLPDSLGLPLAVRIDALDVGRLRVARAQAPVPDDAAGAVTDLADLRELSLSAAYRDGHYRIDRLAFSSPWGALQTRGTLQAGVPYQTGFVLEAAPQFALAGQPKWRPPVVEATVEGPLTELSIAAQVLPQPMASSRSPRLPTGVDMALQQTPSEGEGARNPDTDIGTGTGKETEPPAALGADTHAPAVMHAPRPAGWVGVRTRLRPFASTVAEMLDPLEVQLDAVEPALLDLQDVPDLRVSGRAGLRLEAGNRFSGELHLTNTRSGRIDNERIPVRDVRLSFTGDPTHLRIADLRLALPDDALLQGNLTLDFSERVAWAKVDLPIMQGQVQLGDVDLSALHGGWASTRLAGSVRVERDRLQADIADTGRFAPGAGLTLAVRFDDEQLQIGSARLQTDAGTLEAHGSATLATPWRVDLDGRFSALDPAGFGVLLAQAGLPEAALPADWNGRLDGTWGARGRVWPDPQLATRLTVAPGTLAGRNVQLDWRADLTMQYIENVAAVVGFGHLRARANGALGRASDRLTVALRVGALDELDARAKGTLALTGELAGGWTRVPLSARMKVSASALAWEQDVQLDSLNGELELRDWKLADWLSGPVAGAGSAGAANGARPSGAVEAAFRAQGLVAADNRIDRLDLALSGDRDAHTIDIALSDPERAASLRAAGSLAPMPSGHEGAAAWSWDGRLLQADASHVLVRDERLALRLEAPAGLHVDSRGFSLGGSDWRIGGAGRAGDAEPADGTERSARMTADGDVHFYDEARLRLEELTWANGHYVVRGQARDVPMGAWLSRVAVPQEDETTRAARAELAALHVDAQWDVHGDDPLRPDGRVRIDLPGAVRSEEHGRIDLTLDEGRLDGRVSLHIPTLAFIDRALGPAWSIAGQTRFDGRLHGTVMAPLLDGTLTGQSLALTQHELGWRLDQGSLRADFDGDRLVLHELRLESGEGAIVLSGALQLEGLRGDFELRADRLTVPLGPGERLVVSGTTTITSRQAALQWRGKLRVDEGLIELRGGEVPARPDDVVIIGHEPASGHGAETMVGDGEDAGQPEGLRVLADLELDLGRELRIRGSGADLRLAGSLTLGGSLPENPLAHGTVRVFRGTYTAWGQTLQITRGRVIFDGPIDNPVLDIVAMRRDQPVEAGVSVTGTVLSPRVQLVSDPEVPDAEKLSWLVLGVGFDDAGSGAQMAALQAAAATLLGSGGDSGGLTHALGLDVLTIRSAGTGSGFNQDFGASFPGQTGGAVPDASATGDVLAIGKRLGTRLMVTYEQGLHGVWNIFRIQYAITRRLSLQAQAGTDTALDLLYSFSFDWSGPRRRWQR